MFGMAGASAVSVIVRVSVAASGETAAVAAGAVDGAAALVLEAAVETCGALSSSPSASFVGSLPLPQATTSEAANISARNFFIAFLSPQSSVHGRLRRRQRRLRRQHGGRRWPPRPPCPPLRDAYGPHVIAELIGQRDGVAHGLLEANRIVAEVRQHRALVLREGRRVDGVGQRAEESDG